MEAEVEVVVVVAIIHSIGPYVRSIGPVFTILLFYIYIYSSWPPVHLHVYIVVNNRCLQGDVSLYLHFNCKFQGWWRPAAP